MVSYTVPVLLGFCLFASSISSARDEKEAWWIPGDAHPARLVPILFSGETVVMRFSPFNKQFLMVSADPVLCVVDPPAFPLLPMSALISRPVGELEHVASVESATIGSGASPDQTWIYTHWTGPSPCMTFPATSPFEEDIPPVLAQVETYASAIFRSGMEVPRHEVLVSLCTQPDAAGCTDQDVPTRWFTPTLPVTPGSPVSPGQQITYVIQLTAHSAQPQAPFPSPQLKQFHRFAIEGVGGVVTLDQNQTFVEECRYRIGGLTFPMTCSVDSAGTFSFSVNGAPFETLYAGARIFLKIRSSVVQAEPEDTFVDSPHLLLAVFGSAWPRTVRQGKHALVAALP